MKEMNKNSEYRAISWKERNNYRAYELGQSVQSDKDDKGNVIRSDVYSIEDTSFIPSGTTHFIRRFTIKLITKDGVVFDWYNIENPVNITLMSNHSEFVQI